VKIFLSTFKHSAGGFRALSLGALAAAILALLVAAPASAEATDVASVPPTVESPAIAAQPEPSVSVTAPESTVPEPPETQEVASVPPAKEVTSAPSPGPVTEDIPVDSTPSARPSATADRPVSTAAVDSAVGRVAPDSAAIAAGADSLPSSVAGVSEPGRVEPNAGTVPASTHRLSELAQGIHRDPVGTTAMATGRLTATLADPALQPDDLLNSIVPTSGEAAAPTGLLAAREESPANGAEFPKPPLLGLFAIRGVTAAAPPAEPYAIEASKSELRKIWALKLSGGERVLSPLARTPSAFLSGPATADHNGSPAPSDIPLPAPESPATAVPDAGAPSFVPIVALLALLALVATAALRRLGMAPDFRAPTPFVCALERPG
jgi:hypothetical protein